MSVRALPAAEAIERLAEFSAVIDARSEGEFAEDFKNLMRILTS